MTTSQGIGKNLISPLIKSLDEFSRLSASAPGSSDINRTVGDMKTKLQRLKKQFEHVKGREMYLSEELRFVVRHVDMLKDDATDPQAHIILQEDLKRIEDMINSTAKGMTEYFSTHDTEEDGKVTGSSAAASDSVSSRPSEAEDRQQLLLERNILESDAASHLRLVIENLATRLKHCLLSLTIFPDDAVLKKRLLIHWWIGENIVISAMQGKKCFTELSLRGLIILNKEAKHCHTAHSCKVHPWFRRLLISIATSNAFLEFDSNGTLSENYSRTGRAFLRKGRILAGPSNRKGKEEETEEDEGEEEEDGTLSVYNIDAEYVEFNNGWFAGKKELRALQLGRWQSSDVRQIQMFGTYDFLGKLGACKNLRYLSLRGMSRVENLPDSIGELSSLVVLDLRECHNLEKLTSKVSSLANLEYLDMSECRLLNQLPKGLMDLTKLEVLKGFVIADATLKDPCRLWDLERLKKLRKLSISLCQGASDDELQSLFEFNASLTSLTITWGAVGSRNTLPSAKTAMHLIPRLDKLEKLDIRAFPDPKWIPPERLRSLKKLYIRGGQLQTFEDRECWQTVEVLRLRFLKHLSWDVTGAKEEFFPNLRFVEIHKCPKIASRRGLEDGGVQLVTDDLEPAAKIK